MGVKGSFGLAIDLGTELTDTELKHCYDFIWDHTALEKTTDIFGSFRGLPRISEGKAHIEGQSGQCYTRFDADNLGYPPGWEVPTLMTLSLNQFEQELPENPVLHQFLIALAQNWHQKHPFDLAVIGDLTLYHINAEFALPEWIDLHGAGILGLLLSPRHPLTRKLKGKPLETGLYYYEQTVLKTLWTDTPEQEKHLNYKQKLSTYLHSETLRLEWEKN